MRVAGKFLARHVTDTIEFVLSETGVYRHHGLPTYHTATNILEVKKIITVSDWVKLKTVAPSAGFGYQVLSALMKRDCGLPEIRKLIAALEQCKALNPILKSQFMPAFDVYSQDCTEQDIEFVEGTIDEVLKTFPVITKEIGNYLLRGLPVVPSWEEKRGLILSKLGDKVDCTSFEILAAASFAHGNVEEGLDFMEKSAGSGHSINPRVYHRLLDCHHLHPQGTLAMKVITFIEKHCHMLTFGVAKEIVTILENSGNWVARFLHLPSSGHCNVCREHLKKLPLSTDEYNSLLKDVQKSFDLDCKFTSYQREEVEQFKEFLNQSPSYSAVVDGLNLFYRGKSTEWMKFSTMLDNQGYRALIICRQHLKREREFHRIFKKHLFYYTKDISMDDAFAIYSALSSGKETPLISNDLYGFYSSKMDDPNRLLFRKWQLTNQIIGIGYRGTNMVFPAFTPVCQTSNAGSTIHVPIAPDNNRDVFFPSGWLCIQKVSKKQKKNAEKLWPHQSFELNEESAANSFKKYVQQIKENRRGTKNLHLERQKYEAKSLNYF